LRRVDQVIRKTLLKKLDDIRIRCFALHLPCEVTPKFVDQPPFILGIERLHFRYLSRSITFSKLNALGLPLLSFAGSLSIPCNAGAPCDPSERSFGKDQLHFLLILRGKSFQQLPVGTGRNWFWILIVQTIECTVCNKDATSTVITMTFAFCPSAANAAG
jgi:hypothetical protein